MKRVILPALLAIGLVSLVLSSQGASAAGFVQRSVACPVTGGTLIPPGARIKVQDIVVSTDAATDVTIVYGPPKVTLMTLYLDANDTFVTNFAGQVEGERGQAVKVSCSGVATLSITLVGTEVSGF